MSNRELDERVAREVMGFSKCPDVAEDEDCWIKDGDEHHYENFYPSSDIAAAFLVIEKMREKGWCVDLMTYPGQTIRTR